MPRSQRVTEHVMKNGRGRGFTLVEAAASVVAIAGLLCVLAPAAASSRAAARAGGCSANIGKLSRAVVSHAGDTGSFLPSYVYGSAPQGTEWIMTQQVDQAPNPQNGIVHWSGVLLQGGYVASQEAFTCEAALHGGAPAANPGSSAADWEAGQVNWMGMPSPAAQPSDRQAKRMAYAANGAIMPRNKFVQGSPRKNRIVGFGEAPRVRETDGPVVVAPSNIGRPSSTILLTEFAFAPGAGWQTIGGSTGGGWMSKSYRPITPFVGLSSGADVYAEPDGGTLARFAYPSLDSIISAAQLGPDLFTSGMPELNAVGRHHTGGTANFARVDGSVRQETVAQTIQRREWGERFYSITGRSDVRR